MITFHTFPVLPNDKRPAVESDWEGQARPQDWYAILASVGNRGIACGPSGLVVVDCDVDRVTGKMIGYANFTALCARNSYRLETLEVETPSGGRHCYFSRPADLDIRNSAGKLAPKVDVRANGGYVVAPGSEINGKYYMPEGDPSHIAPAPEWLCEALRRRPEPAPAPGTYNGTFGATYGEAALEGEVKALLMTGEGSRNHRLNEAAFNLGQLVPSGSLTVDRIVEVLEATARAIGLGVTETRKTIESGLRNGAGTPRIARR